MEDSRSSLYQRNNAKPSKFKVKRRQTFHSQHGQSSGYGGLQSTSTSAMHFEVAELIRKPVSNLSVPRIIPQRGTSSSSIGLGSAKYLAVDNRSSYLTVGPPSRPSSVEPNQQRRLSGQSTISDSGSSRPKNYLCPVADLSSVKARIPSPDFSSSDTSPVISRLVLQFDTRNTRKKMCKSKRHVMQFSQ